MRSNEKIANEWVEKIVHAYYLDVKEQMTIEGTYWGQWSEAQFKRIICDSFLDFEYFKKFMIENVYSKSVFEYTMKKYGAFILKAFLLELEKQKAIIELEQMENDDTEK